MKKICFPILIGLMLCALLTLTGCKTNALKVPENLQVDDLTLELSWKEVKGAGYYSISMEHGGETIQRESSKNSCSLEFLSEGEYVIRVRAIASGSNNEYSNSGWSEKYTFVREHETGLAFRLIDGKDAFEVAGLGTAEGDIVIPATYRGRPVTRIGDRAFYNKNTVTGVTLSESITEIGAQAFTNCSYLTSVNLPASLTAIGERAFQSCRVLESPIVIPDGVEVIGAQAFEYCRKLPSVVFGSGVREIGAGAFNSCDSFTTLVIPDDVTTIGDSAFSLCGKLTSLTMGKGVVSIGTEAFLKCTGLTELTLGESVKTIGGHAFAECTAMVSLTMSDAVETIGESAFAGCTVLSNVGHVSTGMKKISQGAFSDTAVWNSADMVYVGNWFLGCKDGDVSSRQLRSDTVGVADYAFQGCEKFPDLMILPDSVKVIGECAFYECRNLINIALGGGAKDLGEKAFYKCSGLSMVFLGSYDNTAETQIGKSSLESIGSNAFYGCTSLEEITIPDTVRSIGSYAFRRTGIWELSDSAVYADKWLVGYKENGGYSSLNIPDGTVGIAMYALYNCTTVSEVVIPDSVKIIGRSAFYNCTNLAKVVLPSGLTRIEDYTFYHCDSLQLPVLPETLTEIGRSAFYKCRFGSSTTDTAEDTLVIPDSVKTIGDFAFYYSGYTYADPTNIDVTLNGGIDILVLGSGVETIGASAFSNFASLRSVRGGENVKNIGEKAFYKCVSLEEFSFGGALNTIGKKAFQGCTSLKAAILPNSVKQIDHYAFYKCTALENVRLGQAETLGDYAFSGCSSLKNISLPTSLTDIGKQAFRNCKSLESVVLHSGLTTVGAHAFYGCEKLTVYAGAVEKPEGWHERWNSSYRPVVWGTSLEDGYVVSFAIGNSRISNSKAGVVLSNPARESYTFEGWSTAPGGICEYTGENAASAPEGTVLYPIWKKIG